MIRQIDIILKILFISTALLTCWPLGAEPGSSLRVAHAQDAVLHTSVLRTTVLEGALPNQSDKHYFGLAPTIRDSWVVVTLAYEPRADLSLSGLVNFAILTEDGLRRYLVGTAIEQASIASGGRVSYDHVGNKLQASFKDSGRGEYTVIVYNNSTRAVNYTLAAEGGNLIDEIGQAGSTAANKVEIQPSSPPTLTDFAASSTAQGVGSASSSALQPTSTAGTYPEIRALRVTSSLDPILDRHYLTVEPAAPDSIVSLNMQYGPLNEPALDRNVNFYVLTEDGLRQVVHGDRPENVNIAVGFPSPYQDKPNSLLAGFQAGGRGPYTVVISNRAALGVQYQMAASDAVLIDRYGQTNESRAALAEYAAIANTQSKLTSGQKAAPVISDALEDVDVDSSPIRTASLANMAVNQRTIELQNQFNLPYQHHYYGLEPTIANGLVQITLAYGLTQEEMSVNPPNFWVLDEDGLRRVISGARPMEVNIANGAIVPNGADEGSLRATFNTSGKGPYTIVIDNNTNSSAEYHIRISGGFLTQAPADSELLLVLP